MTEEIPGGRLVGLDCSMGIVGKKFKEFFIGSGNQSKISASSISRQEGSAHYSSEQTFFRGLLLGFFGFLCQLSTFLGV